MGRTGNQIKELEDKHELLVDLVDRLIATTQKELTRLEELVVSAIRIHGEERH